MADQLSTTNPGPGSAARAAVYWQGGDPRWQTGDIVPLTTTERADVCIVGGGFTGLWTALSIKRLAPDTDVVIIEREYCGAGASGRNGGWVNGWDDILPKLVSRFGRDAALWLVDASRRSLDDLRDTVRDGDIDCDLAFEGGLTVALSPAQVDGVLEAALLARELGRDDLLRILDRDEAVALSGSPAAEAGELILDAGSVQPVLSSRACAGRGRGRRAHLRGYADGRPAAHAAERRQDPSGGATVEKVVLVSGTGCPDPRVARHRLHPSLARRRDSQSAGGAGRPRWSRSSLAETTPFTTRSARPTTRRVRARRRRPVRGHIIPAHRPRRQGDRGDRRRHARHAAGDARLKSSGAGAAPWNAPSTVFPGLVSWAKHRNVHDGRATPVTASASNLSVAPWHRSSWVSTTTTRGRRWSRSRRPTCDRSPSARPADAPCAVPSNAARCWRIRLQALTRSRGRSAALPLPSSMPKGMTLWRRDETELTPPDAVRPGPAPGGQTKNPCRSTALLPSGRQRERTTTAGEEQPLRRGLDTEVGPCPDSTRSRPSIRPARLGLRGRRRPADHRLRRRAASCRRGGGSRAGAAPHARSPHH